ncbi:MAG: metalloregulator ArsR/SmtB family transcription factor [Spirochaetia bacterium]|nr:metalloregulator ArsR/SmtB family transcription factor [Spirochaetia bacterium]MCE1209399.1 metalloregulator ArsR/SmtB family transcription factor [Spirochaetia bacterium]NLX46314.1 winged helix-turn-helix transcriptional regulator [Treponema sp.]
MSDIIDPAQLQRETAIFKALSSEARLAIIYALKGDEKSVGELVEMLGLLECACSVERTNISKHLAVLKEAGIVCCRDEGLKRIYSLALPCLASVFDCVGAALGSTGTDLSSGPCGCRGGQSAKMGNKWTQ